MNGKLKNILFSKALYRFVRIALGLVFVWAGAVKLADPEGFADIISAYGLVPEFLLGPVAVGLPAVEMIAGIGLIFDVKGCLGMVMGLLLMFVFVLWFGILKDLHIDCGCFSSGELAAHESLRQAMYRDMVMIAAGIYLFWQRRLRWVADQDVP